MMTRKHLPSLASAVIVLLAVACGGDDEHASGEIPAASPDWREGYAVGSVQPWIFALESDFVVHADEVTFVDETTSPSGTIPYLRFDATTDERSKGIPTGLRHPSAGSIVPVFESMGVERHPSVLDGRQSDVYLLLGAQEEASAPDGSRLPDVNVVAAFTTDGGSVEWLGPFAEDIEHEVTQAQELVGPADVSELEFVMTLLTELEASGDDPDATPAADSILGRMAAERAAMDDPELAWERAPVDERGLDPEATPADVLEGLVEARIYVANDDEWPAGTIFRIQTDLGISLQVDLGAGFSDGYAVLTPPEATWLVQIGNEEDESDVWETLAEVPASEWRETGAIAVSVTAERAAVETISFEEFDERVAESAVVVPGG